MPVIVNSIPPSSSVGVTFLAAHERGRGPAAIFFLDKRSRFRITALRSDPSPSPSPFPRWNDACRPGVEDLAAISFPLVLLDQGDSPGCGGSLQRDDCGCCRHRLLPTSRP